MSAAELLEAMQDAQRHYLREDVSFYAEQLLELGGGEYLIELAEAFIFVRDFDSAMKAAGRAKGERAEFLFAVAAMESHRFELAEKALRGQKGAFSLHRQGVLFERQRLWERARDSFADSARANPLIVDSLVRGAEMERRVRCSTGPTSPAPPIGENVDVGRSSFTLDNLNLVSSQSLKVGAQPPNRKLGLTSLARLPDSPPPTKKRILKKTKENRNARKTKPRGSPKSCGFLEPLALGLAAFGRGEFAEATAALQLSGEGLLRSRVVSFYLGKAAMLRGRNAEADSHFSRLRPDDPYAKDYHSAVLWSLGKPQRLLDMAHRLDKNFMLDPRTWVALGNCYSALEDHVAASHFLSRALLLSPNDAYAKCLLAHEFYYLGNLPAAELAYRESVSLDPCEANAFWGLGNLALKADRPQKAVGLFEQARKANPGNPLIATFLGVARAALRRFDEAFVAFDDADRLDPGNSLNAFHRASALFEAGRLAEALSTASSLGRNFVDEPKVLVLLAQIHAALGDIPKAHQLCLRALDLDPEDKTRRVRALLGKFNEKPEEVLRITETPRSKR